MKLITIWLINKCNFDCFYCVAKQGLEPIDHEYPPDEWLLEFTGGEPGLYPEIGTLIPELTERGYRGSIQTNGSLYIPQSKNFVRTAAWHFDKRPQHYDSMIIIEGTDGWMGKVKWCRENNVPHRITKLNESFRGKPPLGHGLPLKFITHYAFMNAYGQLANCWKGPFLEDYCIRDMSPPPDFELKKHCPDCGNVKAVELALEEFLAPE